MTTPRDEPPEVTRERSRQRYAIIDALRANFLAAMFASHGDNTRANALREIRGRRLADTATMPPPKDTII
jgi:hypothetical protein